MRAVPPLSFGYTAKAPAPAVQVGYAGVFTIHKAKRRAVDYVQALGTGASALVLLVTC